MARTPVARVQTQVRDEDDRHRRGGIPLWVWPLIPLLLGLLSLGLAMRGGDEQGAADTNRQRAVAGANSEDAANGNAGAAGTNGQGATAGNQGAAGTTGQGAAVTDMLAVVNDPNRASFAGRPATFSNVLVQSVPGDRGFWVGPDANRQLFVAFDEANAGRPEGAIQITPGQTVTLGGVIQPIPPAAQIPPEWGLAPETAASQAVYLQAQQISVGP